MLVYILKSTACLAILFAFYKLFLERENMHVFKRFYLLATLLFALVIPAIVFTEYVEVTPTPSYTITPQATNMNEVINVPQALESDIVDIAPILWTIYFLGVCFFGIKFIKNLFQIFQRIRNNPKQKLVRFTRILLQEKIPPHTFFSYIFLNKTKLESNEIPKEVLLHEETHAEQKHSWDVVFVELLRVIFWVNPFIYLTKKAIKLNHEFLADKAVLKKDIDKATYQNTLLSYLSPDSKKKYQPSLANAVNYSSYSSIKKRFKVMKKITSKKSVLLRSLLLLPLLAVLVYGFSETNLVQIPSEKLYDSEIQETSLYQDELEKINNQEETKIGESLEIKINKNGQLLVHGDLVALENLKDYLSKFNTHLTREQKQQVVRSKIYATVDAPKNVVEKVNTILTEYGSATIDIVEVKSPNYEKPKEIVRIKIKNENEIWLKNQLVQLGDLASTLLAISSSEDIENKLKIEIYSSDVLHSNFLNRVNKEIEKVDVSSIQVFSEEYLMQEKDFVVEGIDPRTAKVQLKTNKMAFEKSNNNQTHEKKEILINIKKNGKLLVQDNLVALENLKNYLLKINPNSSNKEERKFDYCTIFAEEDIPSNIIENVNSIVTDHGVTRINVLNPSDTSELYFNRYQGKATPKQVSEYNALAKKYNAMLSKSKSIQIKMKDVERLEYIYGLMSNKQRADAEPFPNFPEPPPVPNAPGASTTNNNQWVVSTGIRSGKRSGGERASFPPPAPVIAISANSNEYSKELKSSIENYLEHIKSYEESVQQYRVGKIKDIESINASYEKAMKLYKSYYEVAHREGKFIQPTPPNAPNPPEVKIGEKSDIPPPPPPTPDEVDFEEVEKIIATQEINAIHESAIQIFHSDQTPPSPPAPKSPLDFVIEMAKKNAVFYYKGQEITSDKAIDIIKKNKNMNIDARGTNNNRPTVKLSTQPIVIDH